MTKLDAGLITSLPASDPGSAAVWGSKRINPRPQFCLCLAWSGCPSNDDDDDEQQNTKIFIKCKAKLRKNYALLIIWIKFNRLFLNYSKSTYFIVTTKHKMNTVNQISFQIGPNRIISFNSTKYLRIFIDSDLKLYNHIKYILYFINLLFQLESYLL